MPKTTSFPSFKVIRADNGGVAIITKKDTHIKLKADDIVVLPEGTKLKASKSTDKELERIYGDQ